MLGMFSCHVARAVGMRRSSEALSSHACPLIRSAWISIVLRRSGSGSTPESDSLISLPTTLFFRSRPSLSSKDIRTVDVVHLQIGADVVRRIEDEEVVTIEREDRISHAFTPI